MLTEDESRWAPRIFNLLLHELNRLGMNQDSAGYQTVLKAIRNLFTNFAVSPVLAEKVSNSQMVKEEINKSNVSEIKSELKSTRCLDAQLEEAMEMEVNGFLGLDIVIPSQHRTEAVVTSENQDQPRNLINESCEERSVAEGRAISTGATYNWGEAHQFGCPYYPCAMAYATFIELREHIMVVHQSRQQFVCSWNGCSEILESSDVEMITQHTMMHLDPPPPPPTTLHPMVDGYTQQVYNIPAPNLVTGGLGGKPTCNVCRKTFKYHSELVRHGKVHTGTDRPFICPVEGCGKTYNRKNDLRDHSRSHTGDRPFKCPWDGCVRSFNRRNLLDNHIRTHTGDRPFKCSWQGCQKSFARRDHFINHTRTHTGDRPFRCSWQGCKKSFARRDHLVNHTRTHKKSLWYH